MDNKNELLIDKFKQLIILHKVYFNKAASDNGLYYGQLPILEYIINHKDCTQAEIAKYMNVTPSSVATSVKRMENAGLIKRTSDPSDLRYNRLKICEKGIQCANKCRHCFDSIDRRMFDQLTNEEKEVFIHCLEKMIYGLDSE